MKNKLVAMVGGAAFALASCATFDYAESNTKRLSSGVNTETYQPARIDWMYAGHDKYAVNDRTPGTSIQIEHPTAGTITLPRALTLDGRGIPYSNSTTERRSGTIETSANETNSYLVNVTMKDGKPVIPTFGEPRETFWHVYSEKLPSRIKEDSRGTFESEIFERIVDHKPYVAFNSDGDEIRLVPFPFVDTLGRRARLYMDVSKGIEPLDREVRIPGQPTQIIRGFEAVGYTWLPGTEVPINPSSLDEDLGKPFIIGGEQIGEIPLFETPKTPEVQTPQPDLPKKE